MFAIIVSNKDVAGMNIKDNLIKLGFKKTIEKFERETVYSFENIKLYTTSKDSIHCENIDEEIIAELIIFATKHRSAAGIPSLSLHAPGNWDKAELGGEEKEICIAPAIIMKKAFEILNDLGKDTKYEITMEVTHHGPLLKKTPCFFIEIGSTEKQWPDKFAGKIIASTILKTLQTSDFRLQTSESKLQTVVGFGGGHYAPYFNKIQLREGFAIGHMIPKYATENLTKDQLIQAIKRTSPKANLILLDWKGLGPRKQEFMQWIEEIGINSQRCRKLTRENQKELKTS